MNQGNLDMSQEEREEILEAYENLRVTDVCDGMDWNMLFDVGLVSKDISPLWRMRGKGAKGSGLEKRVKGKIFESDELTLSRTVGIAKTIRLMPTMKRIPTMSPEEYDDYVKYWYGDVMGPSFSQILEDGDMLVLDCSNLDVGVLGSNNSLDFINKGARGIITNGGCRDTDEVIIEEVPVWCRHISRTMDQGRIEFSDMMNPVNIGGVVVNPGDVVVADGDGVIVVPREKALDVAKYARQEHENDNETREKLYEQAGLPKDETLS